jgi:putative endonuclease
MWNPFRRQPVRTDTDNQSKGAAGEDAAARFLKREGYRIVERNYTCPPGEVDIVAREGSCLCFVEVKARSGPGYGSPLEAVTKHKQRQIIRAAQHYLVTQRVPECDCRFDVVSVERSEEGTHEVTLIRDAFRA